MLPLSILEKKSHCILFELAPGKPDPKQQCTTGEDERERVLQTGLKGAACWYYTFNYLRKRIGKNPSNEFLKQRALEKLCSQRRKELTTYDNAFPLSVAELYSKSESSVLRRLDMQNAQLFLKSDFSSLFNDTEKTLGRESVVPYVKEFIKEKKHNNLHEFLLFKRSSKLIEVNMKFLSNFKTDVHKMIDSKHWNELDLEQKAASLETYVRDLHADFYNLRKSSWKPLEGIDKLIEELKDKGPLMILGNFGPTAYEDQPFKMSQKISTRDIYAWRPGAKRQELIAGHSVLLVGAKKTQDNAFAYFIDPNDPSDPQDRSKQKIYMISYTNLTSNICSLIGRKELDCDFGYAYAGYFKV